MYCLKELIALLSAVNYIVEVYSSKVVCAGPTYIKHYTPHANCFNRSVVVGYFLYPYFLHFMFILR